MSLTVVDLARIMAKLRTAGKPTPYPIKLTREQLEQIKDSSVVLAGWPDSAFGAPVACLGTPIEIVEAVEDSTPWQQELL